MRPAPSEKTDMIDSWEKQWLFVLQKSKLSQHAAALACMIPSLTACVFVCSPIQLSGWFYCHEFCMDADA